MSDVRVNGIIQTVQQHVENGEPFPEDQLLKWLVAGEDVTRGFEELELAAQEAACLNKAAYWDFLQQEFQGALGKRWNDTVLKRFVPDGDLDGHQDYKDDPEAGVAQYAKNLARRDHSDPTFEDLLEEFEEYLGDPEALMEGFMRFLNRLLEMVMEYVAQMTPSAR